MKKATFLIIILFSVLSNLGFLKINKAKAQSLSTPVLNPEYHIGQTFSVPILLSSPNTSVNAVNIVVYFPESLEFVGTDEADSIVNLWVEKPHIENKTIILSGIIPNGFTEILNPLNKIKSPGLITKLIFKGKKESTNLIRVSPELYSNDGNGTKIASTGFSLSVKIDDINIDSNYDWNDKVIPEIFTPTIEKNQNLYNGKYFLVFSAIDKDSGIAKYEVREGKGSWKDAQSPYLLSDQKLTSDIYIRAIDKAGNIRTASLSAQNIKVLKSSSQATQYISLILLLITIIALRKRIFRLK